jgi:hypothetical protein
VPNRPHLLSVNTPTGVAESGNNTETVMATMVGVIPEVPSQPIRLRAVGTITLGASSVGGTFRFRRSTLAGTLVGTAKPLTALATAAGLTDFAIEDEDNPGEGNFTYVFTYQGTGDTGVATVTQSEFTASWY